MKQAGLAVLLTLVSGCGGSVSPGAGPTSPPTRSPGPAIPLPTRPATSPVPSLAPGLPQTSPTPTSGVVEPPPATQARTATVTPPLRLQGPGAWVEFCDSRDNRIKARSVPTSGSPVDLQAPCGLLARVSPGGAFGVLGTRVEGGQAMGLFQMPEAQLVRAWDGETAAADHAWSPSGRYLLMEMDGSVAGSVELAIYDTQADQVSKVTASTGMLIPMSWSPDETWFVFAEAPASGDGPSVVYAARPDGSIVRRLYSSGGSDSGVDAIIGWLSESSFLGVEPVEFCNRSLYSYNVVSGERERLLGWNSAGVLGDDGTIMLAIYQGGPCAYEWPQGLYRLTSAGGWAPQRILGTGDATSLGEVKWMPRAGLFAVCEGYQGESQLVLRSTNGQAVDSFACSDRLYPSPDGTSIVVSKRDGTLELEPARRAQRIPISRLPVKDVVWLPGGDGFVATTEDGRLWAAESAHDWHPVQLASGIDPARMPVVVQPPQASFELPCPSAPGSRLHVGDRAKVSSVPPVSSRLRESPGVDAAPSGSLGPGTAVRILEGPVCAGGRVWWRVGADDGSQAGWTVESDWQGAWLVAP